MPKIKAKEYISTVGRRKTSIARIRLHKGKEQHIVNNLPIGQYFNFADSKILWNKPFQVTDTEGKYYVTAKVLGGGKHGQLDAYIHGVARALAKLNPDTFKVLLRKNGLLTRDSRARERRMVGKGGKSRRAKQSPKR